MRQRNLIWAATAILAWSGGALAADPIAGAPRLELRPHDRIALVGNSLAERMRLYGNLEARLHLRFPQHELAVRNFGWPCDEPGEQQRPEDYTALDDPLGVFAPDVLFCFFGFNDSFAGAEGLPKFKTDLAEYVRKQRTALAKDGQPPRIVLVSPIAYEATGNPLMSDGKKENENLKLYSEAVAEVAKAEGLPFVDLFTPTAETFAAKPQAEFTINGAHLNEAGDQFVASSLDRGLFPAGPVFKVDAAKFEKVRAAVVDMEWVHHQDYRMLNGWYVYGSRSRPLDTETFRPEYAKIRKMCADRDRVIWARPGDEAAHD